MNYFSEGDKLKYYQNGQTKQASQQATGHPEAVGAAGSSVGAAGDIEAVEVLEPLGGHEDEDTTHPIESILHSLDIMQTKT